MIMPRFTIRTGLAIVTGCALFFVVVGVALRGEGWAWGIAIAVISLLITLLVHAAWFGLVTSSAGLASPQAPGPVPSLAPALTAVPTDSIAEGDKNRGEAKP